MRAGARNNRVNVHVIILCAGAYSSGSTWIFNVVRKLLSATGKTAFSIYSPSAGYVLSQLSTGVDTVIVKSHTVDRDFWALSHLADVRIIRSRREPRDAVASLMERFGTWYHDAFVQVEQSLASLAAIPNTCRMLDLRYESGFTRDVATVQTIADFLSLPVTSEGAAAIFDALRPEQVVQTIAAIHEAVGRDAPTSEFDTGTHWQSSHLRTGESGTWSRQLDDRLATAVLDAMAPLLEPDGWTGTPIRWSALLCYDAQRQRPQETGKLALPGPGGFILSGPDLFLPSGRWRAVLTVAAPRSGYDVHAILEIFFGGSLNRVGALQTVTISATGADQVVIEFDHADERNPIGIRLVDVPGNKAREIIFHGVTLNWLGASLIAPLSDALPILPTR